MLPVPLARSRPRLVATNRPARTIIRVIAGAVATTVLVAAGCVAPERAAAPSGRASAVPSLASGDGTTPLSCPTSLSATALGVLGPLGGVIEVGAARLELPAGAVSRLTAFVVSVPAGDRLQVDAHALGLTSFHFRAPARITVSYARCGDVDGPLRAWYVDDSTGALLEDMGGVTDPVAKTHTFETKHLSGYVIAN
jgi:hypothetical protein